MLLEALFFAGRSIWQPMPSIKQVGNNVIIRSWIPMRSIMFDAQYTLVSSKRIPEWLRFAEDEPSIDWSVCEINIWGFYNKQKPKFMILKYPILGYRYYKIDHVDGEMVFSRQSLPKSWKEALEKPH
jgi:hypothetical protein